MTFLFEHLLSRADAPQLAELMPSGATKLLNAIDPQLAYPRNLVKVLLALRGPADLLSDSSTRKMLLELLPPDQATVLASLIDSYKGNDAYGRLRTFSFTKKSDLKTLFSFFGVGIPEESDDEAIPSDTLVDAAYPLFSHQNSALRDLRSMLSSEPHRALLERFACEVTVRRTSH